MNVSFDLSKYLFFSAQTDSSKVTDLFTLHKLHSGQWLSKICIISDDSSTVLHTLQLMTSIISPNVLLQYVTQIKINISPNTVLNFYSLVLHIKKRIINKLVFP
jgi:hypothetical protein